MAKGKKTGGRNFAIGNRANPKGRPPVPEDIKAARKLSKTEVERILHEYVFLTRDELAARLAGTATPTIEAAVANLLRKTVALGDVARLDWVVSRLIGKVKDQIQVEEIRPVVIERRDGSEVELGYEKEEKE